MLSVYLSFLILFTGTVASVDYQCTYPETYRKKDCYQT